MTKLLWRIFLTACLLLSLGKTQAEERPNQLLTALSSTAISGYVSTSAEWDPTTVLFPQGLEAFPVVFITAPRIVREYTNPITGATRGFAFTVHRFGRTTEEVTVYLRFELQGGAPVKGGVTIPAGARKATTTWFVPDDGVYSGPRAFTASISMTPVRLQMPGARYQTSLRWPASSTVVILDPGIP